jgi:hypothetical protein
MLHQSAAGCKVLVLSLHGAKSRQQVSVQRMPDGMALQHHRVHQRSPPLQ